MAEDPNPTLRSELMAAFNIITPQVRGLNDLTKVSLSDPVKAVINDQIFIRTRRKDKIQNVLNALDNVIKTLVVLEDDGYPVLPHVEVDKVILTELEEQKQDVNIAINIFEPEEPASTVKINLGGITDK